MRAMKCRRGYTEQEEEVITLREGLLTCVGIRVVPPALWLAAVVLWASSARVQRRWIGLSYGALR